MFNMKKIIGLIVLLIFFTLPEISFSQQDGMFKGKNKHRHRHRGKRERKNKTAYNPYIDPDTNKPKRLASKEMAKDNKKAEKQQKRAIRREKRKLRRQGKGYSKK